VTAQNPTHSLGSYQRDIGKHLTDTPMSPRDAKQFISGQDHGYAAATLIRLEERSIAKETAEGSYLYVRGPLWAEAAAYHGWEEER
jgi:hypothetical protein